MILPSTSEKKLKKIKSALLQMLKRKDQTCDPQKSVKTVLGRASCTLRKNFKNTSDVDLDA
jgi:hypothetical protein